MKRKELVRKLEAAGFKLDRNKTHAIYEKPNSRPIPVPNHKEIKDELAKKILRDAGL